MDELIKVICSAISWCGGGEEPLCSHDCNRGPKVLLLGVATFRQGGPGDVGAEGSAGTRDGIPLCKRYLAADPAGNWRTWESCHQSSLFLWLAQCLAGWHLVLLRGEKPPVALLQGEKGGVAQSQRSVLSHSKSLITFENLDRARRFAQLLLSGSVGGDCFLTEACLCF